jgi:hypothetical protein
MQPGASYMLRSIIQTRTILASNVTLHTSKSTENPSCVADSCSTGKCASIFFLSEHEIPLTLSQHPTTGYYHKAFLSGYHPIPLESLGTQYFAIWFYHEPSESNPNLISWRSLVILKVQHRVHKSHPTYDIQSYLNSIQKSNPDFLGVEPLV